MDLRRLNNKLEEKAIEELNEDPTQIPQILDLIKEWLRKQLHLNARTDSQRLVAFCRGCKWNIQRIKERLDYFYTIKNITPEFFENRDPLSTELQKVLNAGSIFIMPKVRNYLGPRICMLTFGKIDINDTPLLELCKVFFMMLDILMQEDDDFVVSGITVITDYSNIPASYLLQFTPSTVKKYTKCFQNAYPVRIKGYYCLNAPTILDKVYHNLCKPFLSSKLQQRVNIANTFSSEKIFKAFSHHLPKEYGGENGTIKDAAEEWKNKIESYRDWFLDDKQYTVNEKLRQRNSKCFQEEFGVEGSFRKLTID
ncbi:hypothetical protein RI129_004821 [Pyrocoelia pectoralis]|uniref:CRAL-TRIO domain-containing protein n=1 Tax=Pyrocoelia pectoralis TaxID=417401 RepID=A0AAN7ZKX6_9COLE